MQFSGAWAALQVHSQTLTQPSPDMAVAAIVGDTDLGQGAPGRF